MALPLTRWGHSDYSVFYPHNLTEENLMKEIFNLVFHLKLSVTEVLTMPTKMRQDLWKLFLDQRKFDEGEIQKAQQAARTK